MQNEGLSRDVPPRAPRSPSKSAFLEYRPNGMDGLRAAQASSDDDCIRPRSSDLSDITEHRAYHNESSFRNQDAVDYSEYSERDDTTPEPSESSGWAGTAPLLSDGHADAPLPQPSSDDYDDDVDVSLDVDIVDDEEEDFSVSLSDGEGGGIDTDSRLISCSSSIDTHEGLGIDAAMNEDDDDVVGDVDDDDQSFASTSASTAKHDPDRDESARLARRETRLVKCLRLVIILTLLALGVALSTSLWHVAHEKELHQFEEDFGEFASLISSAVDERAARTVAAIGALSLHVTSATASAAWPQITVGDFHLHAANAKLLANSIRSVSLLPQVTSTQRPAFETYALANMKWMEDAIQFQIPGQRSDGSNNGRRKLQDNAFINSVAGNGFEFLDGVASKIYSIDGTIPQAETGSGPFFPIRHVSPLVEKAAVNYNAVSNLYTPAPSTDAVVFGRFIETGGKNDTDASVVRSLLVSPDGPGDALGLMTYPIFDSSTTDKTSVGAIATLLDWGAFLADVLPTSVGPIICVVENTCGQQYSFEVNGRSVDRLGFGDSHDSLYDNDGVIHELDSLSLTQAALQVPLDSSSGCQYLVRIYPTDEFRDGYTTSTPVNYAIVTAVVFFLITFVFIAYDCVVERRQRLVLKSAMEARAIVSSLFPAVVRDRLFQNNRDKQERRNRRAKQREQKKQMAPLMEQPTLSESPKIMSHIDVPQGVPGAAGSPQSPLPYDSEQAPPVTPASIHQIMNGLTPTPGAPDEIVGTPVAFQHKIASAAKLRRGSMVQHPKHRLKTFLQHGTTPSGDDTDEFGLGLAKPIADLFPHTTVLFADIAGFTAWSSEREPEQVFTLLQTIYHAFDKIAKRRSVFKVETIGDCYVAVTGLPEEQPDHAVRMTKFARECMTRMNEVTKRLEVALGPDTGDLCMRLGLHSGPVTAGVLQGEKSRFQLFGDTVNTASRMESTGERSRIQISQATADLLIAAGKDSWIRPRQDLVRAKGKGEIQTYWIVSRNGSMPLSARHSGSGLLHDMVRKPPPRSRSAMPTAGPLRKSVTRATSDTVSKLTKMAKSASMSVSSTQSASSTSSAGKVLEDAKDKRVDRLIEWQVEIFARLLKKIVSARGDSNKSIDSVNTGVAGLVKPPVSPLIDRSNAPRSPASPASPAKKPPTPNRPRNMAGDRRSMNIAPTRAPSFRLPTRRPSIGIEEVNEEEIEFSTSSGNETIVMDEVAEVITLPKFNARATKTLADPESIKLPPSVLTQLHDYIKTISTMYRPNPFHNFEHASHVTMSANKLLNRIVIPENVDYQRESNAIASDLHDYTYGITSDPLTHFAVIFSALIHDVDHAGVPNGRLAVENPGMAQKYRNQSIAEQNSVDLAWGLLTSDRFQDLQACIFANNEERDRFRQLIVNSVMATDIFDKDMKALRNKRWDKAFHRDLNLPMPATVNIDEDINMKATIVIEHIIQASDVAHTMQHWHIYQKWNERLFCEMYAAFESGRSDNDPTKGWFKGEIWFFDNYVIPLAKKLEECNVFGVASDECLQYAIANRNEWNIKGETIVLEMVSRYQKRKFMSQLGLSRVPSRTKSRSAHQA